MTDETPDWIEQLGPVDRILKTVAVIAVDRLGGEIEFTRQEWDTIQEHYGGNAVLHVKGDNDAARAVLTTREAVRMNPYMKQQEPN